jgi:GT2 family glycosyltransferase
MEQNRVTEEKFLVSVVVLAYNGEKEIVVALDSVLNQTYENIEIIIVDNASTDSTAKKILQYRETCSSKIKIISNPRNVGLAGYNAGIDATRGDFVFCVNQDATLNENFIAMALKCFMMDEKIGAVQGKILKKKIGIGSLESGSETIDSAGLAAFKSRRFVDRGQGEEDKGQYDRIEEVFGVNGAVAFFRKKCLEDVKIDSRFRGNDNSGEYYDYDFFMYKEDIDLSWRIRLYGWKIIYCPEAVAYVERTSRPIGDKSGAVREVIKARKQQTQFVKNLSFKNHRLAIAKNDLSWLFLKHLPWILPREIAAWSYALVFEPKTWPAIGELFRQLPQARKKRKIIMKNKKVGAREMGKWFM